MKVNAKPVSLADAYAKVAQRPDPNRRRQRERSSAIRSLSRWTNRRDSELPVDPKELRKVFDQVNRSGVGIRPHTLANVKSICLDMITESGFVEGLRSRGGRQAPLSPTWSAYVQRLPTRRLKTYLKRYVRFLSEENIKPTAANDAVYARYTERLGDLSLQANLHRVVRDTAKAWNEARPLFPDLDLPAITVPASKRQKTLTDIDLLPATFQSDDANFSEWASGLDIFAKNARRRQLSPRTVAKIKQDIRRAVTFLIKAGTAPESITGFATLLTIENFTTILRGAHAEKGGLPSSYNFHMALSLMAIGRDFLKLDPAVIEVLTQLTYKIPRPPQHITVKNTKLIGRFDDAATIKKLVEAPQDLWKIVKSHKKPNRWTLSKAQAAIAIAMLPVIPLRLGNLSALTFDEHVFLRPNGVSTITVPAHENKSGTALAFDIPPNLVDMLMEYRNVIVPKIIGCRPRYLFCRDDGERKNFATVRANIQTYLIQYLGFHMNPHAFRHLAAKITLDQDPGAHGQVQQFLGHKTIMTTENFYVGWDTKRAQQGHIRNLEKTLAAAGDRLTKKNTRKEAGRGEKT